MTDEEKDEFRDVLILELDERVNELEDEAKRYKKNPEDKNLKDDIMRTLHSIKGLFSLAGYPKISTIAHHFESVVVEGEMYKDDQFMDMLTYFSDELDNLSKALKASKEFDLLRFDKLTQQLASIDEFMINLGKHLRIKVEIDPKCKVTSARALVLVNKIKQISSIESCMPPIDEIQEGITVHELNIDIITQEGEENIRDTIKDVQDVTNITITPLLDSLSITKDVSDTIQETLNVRVRLEELDKIIRLLGDLVVYGQFIREIGEDQAYMRGFRENLLSFERTISNIQDLVIKMRLVPLETILNRFPRMIRELSKKENKEVELLISGKHIGVDRSIIEQLVDPITHILRNAISHGIEQSEERKKKGKDTTGLINLMVSQEKSDIIIEIMDDGKGIDYDAIQAIATEKGYIEKGAELTKEEVHQILLTHNISTISSGKATEISGRGFGLSSIRSIMENIGGSIEIESKPDVYTVFKLIIPLSVAINKILLLTVKGHQFALPMDDIQQILSVPTEKFYTDENTQGKFVLINENPVPIVNLRERFSFDKSKYNEGETSKKDRSKEIVVLWQKRGQSLGFIVDELLGEREVVIKPIQDFLKQIGAFSSATVLEGGQVILIIDPMNFLEVGLRV